MTVPSYSDLEVLEKLYARFPYLSGQPLTLRGSGGSAPSIGTIEEGELLAFVPASDDERPYPAAFPFLSEGENRGLSRHVQVQPVEPWPQPLVDVVWGERGAGLVSSIGHVDVLLKPVGFGQLWFRRLPPKAGDGGETGVLWKGYFERPVRTRSDHDALLHRLWELCEGYLAAKGVRFVHTYNRDPTFDEGWCADFLQARGYVRDAARAHLPGGAVAVVKDLDTFYGDPSSSRYL